MIVKHIVTTAATTVATSAVVLGALYGTGTLGAPQTAPVAAVNAPAAPVAQAAPQTPAQPPTAPAGTTAPYANCAAVRAAGKAPIHRGDPGWADKLDHNHDGVACA